MNKNQDIIILGAGVAGCSLALDLAKRGLRVRVIDKRGIGFGCSYGNAGWITPCFAMPLPMPGMFFKSIGWLLDPESPLYIKPEPSILLMRWLWRFMRSMNERQMQKAIAVLTASSKFSLDAYAQLNREYPQAFSFTQKGLLMVGATKAGVAAAEEERRLVEKHGIPGKLLSPAQIRELEPALIGELAGGVYFPQEAHGEPLAVVQTLAEAAKKAGAEFLTQTEYLHFTWQGKSIRSLVTTRGEFFADVFVLAAGSWSERISHDLPIRIPILGGKGYSLIVPKYQGMPQIPTMLVEKKIALTPRADSLRVAGTLELVNQDFSVTERRVKAIEKGARQYIQLPTPFEVRELWRGLRPCTPDGVPLVGMSKKVYNLCLLTGHQMLGLQSAPGTARLAAESILGLSSSFDPKPFDPDRF